MPNLVQLDAGSYIKYANNSALAAAPKVWGAFSCTGESLKNAAADGGYVTLDAVARDDFSAWKFIVLWAGPFGAFPGVDDSASGITPFTSHTGLDVSALDNATMYDVGYVLNDNAALGGSIQSAFFIYAQGDLWGTPLAQWSTTTATAIETADAARGVRFLGGSPPIGLNNVAGTFDWGKIGDDNTLAIEDSELEEGTGTAVAPSGTIVGTFSWQSAATGPDHGVVSLDASTIPLVGGTTTAHVDWQDASNVSLDPQPSTTWDIPNDSQAVTIDRDTGVVTAQAAGTATVRATSGAKTATAEITVTNPYSFTGSIT